MNQHEIYPNIMVDIETMGTKPGSAILAIAAAHFDIETGKIHREYVSRIEFQSSIQAGLTIDAGTVEFWMGQDKEAQEEVMSGRDTMYDALMGLYSFVDTIRRNERTSQVNIWANGINFDPVLLEAAYSKMSMDIPWRHSHVRDVRTLVAFYPYVRKEYETKFFKENKQHVAINDVRCQIGYLHEAYARITGSVDEETMQKERKKYGTAVKKEPVPEITEIRLEEEPFVNNAVQEVPLTMEQFRQVEQMRQRAREQARANAGAGFRPNGELVRDEVNELTPDVVRAVWGTDPAVQAGLRPGTTVVTGTTRGIEPVDTGGFFRPANPRQG